jgi:hypothetical protein
MNSIKLLTANDKSISEERIYYNAGSFLLAFCGEKCYSIALGNKEFDVKEGIQMAKDKGKDKGMDKKKKKDKKKVQP